MFTFAFTNEFYTPSNFQKGKRFTFEKIRKIDPNLSNLKDEELEIVEYSLRGFVQLIFDDWYEQKFGSKNHVRSFTNKR